MSNCEPKNAILERTIDITMQITIILTFLSIFFYGFGAPIIKNAFTNALGNNISSIFNRNAITDNLHKIQITPSMINNLPIPQATKTLMLQELTTINDLTDQAIKKAKLDEYINKYFDILTNAGLYTRLQTYYMADVDNSALFDNLLYFNVFAWTLLIVMIVCVKLSCGEIGLLPMTGRNVTIILLVGFVEMIFFYFVASKYIPTNPSTISKTIIDDMKQTIK